MIHVTVRGCSAQEKELWNRLVAMVLDDLGWNRPLTLYIDDSCFTSSELGAGCDGWCIDSTVALRPGLIARPLRAYVVLAHELGHVLGLKHVEKRNVMTPYAMYESCKKGVWPTARQRVWITRDVLGALKTGSWGRIQASRTS